MSDARALVEHARVETTNHWFLFNEHMPVESVSMAISQLCLSFADKDKKKEKDEGKKRVARPFGVSMLVAGIDSKGPQLFCTDPSGNYIRYKACAIGPASESAMSLILEHYKVVSKTNNK